MIKIYGQNKNPYLIYIWPTSTCYTPLEHFELTVYLLHFILLHLCLCSACWISPIVKVTTLQLDFEFWKVVELAGSKDWHLVQVVSEGCVCVARKHSYSTADGLSLGVEDMMQLKTASASLFSSMMMLLTVKWGALSGQKGDLKGQPYWVTGQIRYTGLGHLATPWQPLVAVVYSPSVGWRHLADAW